MLTNRFSCSFQPERSMAWVGVRITCVCARVAPGWIVAKSKTTLCTTTAAVGGMLSRGKSSLVPLPPWLFFMCVCVAQIIPTILDMALYTLIQQVQGWRFVSSTEIHGRDGSEVVVANTTGTVSKPWLDTKENSSDAVPTVLLLLVCLW